MMSVVECLGVGVTLMSLLSAANAAYCRDGLYYFYCGDGCCYSRSYTYYSYTTVCCSATTEGWMIGMGVGVAVVVVLMIICVLYCRYMASKKATVGATGAKSSQPTKTAAQPVRVGTVVHSQDGAQANYHPPPPPPPPQPQMNAFANPAYPPPPLPNPAYPPPPPPPNPAFPPPGNPAYPPPPAYSYGNAPY